MTRPQLCDVCKRPFLAHEKAEAKVPPMARHQFTSHGAPPRTIQDDLDIDTTQKD